MSASTSSVAVTNVGDLNASPKSLPVAYETCLGRMINASVEQVLETEFAEDYKGKIQLIFTSPPFPLNTKKKYGNLQGKDYIEWLAGFAGEFCKLLTPDGSIVMELGNAWERGQPVMSTLALKALLSFLEEGELKLNQQFVCHNPARLPSPAQWVTVERIRVKDSYTHVWWMSPSTRPKADNRRVLKPYSRSMRKLLERQTYNSGRRPSEHNIGTDSFLKEHDGAIPSNVLSFANTSSIDDYQQYCRSNGLQPHPARMHPGLVEFFIRFLSDPGDLVLDPFAGSNTTGAVCERLGRRWLAIESLPDYVAGSRGRFSDTLGPPSE